MADSIAKTIYAQQAVREYMGWPRLKLSRSVRVKIDRLIGQVSESEPVLVDGMYHPNEAFANILRKEVTIRIDGKKVDINPFTCDAIDMFLLLKARDADQAANRNGQGFNKPDSVIARRLLDRLLTVGLHPNHVAEVFGIALRYRAQVADEISRGTGLAQGEVSDILKARFKLGAITRTTRMAGLTDASLVDMTEVTDGPVQQPKTRRGQTRKAVLRDSK